MAVTATEEVANTNQRVRELRAECLAVIADAGKQLNHWKDTLNGEYIGGFLERDVEHMGIFFRSFSKCYYRHERRVKKYEDLLWCLQMSRDHVVDICLRGGLPDNSSATSVHSDYDWSVQGRLQRAVDCGYLDKCGDGSYFLTAKGDVIMSRELRYFLSRGIRFDPEYKLLEGLTDDTTESDWYRRSCFPPHYWNRVRSALIESLPDDVLHKLEVRRGKPCKVKVDVPEWIRNLVPIMLKDVEMLDKGFNVVTGEEVRR